MIMLAAPLAGTAAEPVRVRSGEHPGFSRLVLDFDRVPRWSLSADGTRRSVTFAGPPVQLQIDEVYERIGRNRIRGIRAGVNRLDLELGCDCRVMAYTLAGGRLVIDVGGELETRLAEADVALARPRVLSDDIREDPPAGRAPPGGPLDAGYEPQPPASLSSDLAQPPSANSETRALLSRKTPGLMTAPVADPVARRLERPGIAIANSLAQTRDGSVAGSGRRPESGLADAVVTPWPLQPTDARDRLDTATEALADALERAAAQGLIDLAPGEALTSPGASSHRQLPETSAGTLPLPIGQEPNLRVTTSLDRELSMIVRRLEDDAGSSCLANFDLNVGSWGPPDGSVAGLSDLRAQLFGEFDTPDPDAARVLARRYIYLSFGAEALAVLDAVALPEDEAAVLRFLAEIADGRTRRPDDTATSLLKCPGFAAMWGLIAIAKPSSDVKLATGEIAGAFSDLPLHLRRHYGPALVDRFLFLGQTDAARIIWTAVDRAGGDHGERFVLATADLANAEGDATRAERDYAALEGASPANAALAVLRLLRSRLARDGHVDRNLVDSAAALAFENRGTPVSRELKLAELSGRIAIDAWDEVFAELPRARFSGALGADDATAVLAELYTAMADHAGVGDFLRRGVEADERLPVSVASDGARRALAERFLDLGLADQAEGLIAGLAEPGPADGLLKARSHIVAGRFGAAEAALAGRTGLAADRLRAEAFLGLGRYREAAAIFEAAGETVTAARSAARGGAWDKGPEAIRTAATELSGEDTAPLPETPLARNRALVENAGALRESISAFLAVASKPETD